MSVRGDGFSGTRLGLLPHQSGVRAVRGHQLVMAPHLHCPTLVQDQYPVSIDDTRQAVSDDERSSILHQPVKGALDHRLVLGVHTGERLVQEQDRRVLQQRPRDRQTLPLSSR